MPLWAKGLLLARVSRVPNAVRLEWAGSQHPRDEPVASSPAPAAGGTGGLKRKRELGECAQAVPTAPAPPDLVRLRGCSVSPGGPSTGGVHGAHLEVKDESPSYSPVPGEDSVATGYIRVRRTTTMVPTSCPGWAIKRRLLHLVYTSAYQGDDCTGAYWASASPGEGVAMRVVDRLADTAIDPWTDDDGGAKLPPRGRPLRGAVLVLDGDPTLSASVRVRIGRVRGAPPRRPPHWADTGDPLWDPQWGFVRRLGTAFGLCASGRPRTLGPLTWASGIWTASGMLLWLPQESPA